MAYQRLPKSKGCPFCNLKDTELNPIPRKILQETTHMVVMGNMFPYQIWEHHDVLEHYMIVPKRHVGSLKELTPAERTEIMDLFSEYEARGYNIYTRATESKVRTLAHIHVHLIKIDHKKPRLSIAIAKPYTVFKF